MDREHDGRRPRFLLDVAGLTHRGNVRELNQDHWQMRELPAVEGVLLMVADGMANPPGGERASRIAVQAVLDRFDARSVALGEEPCLESLAAALREAHEEVLGWSAADLDFSGMGTTAVVAVVRPHLAYYQYCGDSRLYWMRPGTILRKTRDHSVVQALLEMGQITPEVAARHSMAGQLTSFLGGGSPWERVQLSPAPGESARLDLKPGDVILLCTDGVPGELSDEQLLELATAPGTAAQRAKAIIDAVLAGKARDNATVVVAVVQEQKGDGHGAA